MSVAIIAHVKHYATVVIHAEIQCDNEEHTKKHSTAEQEVNAASYTRPNITLQQLHRRSMHAFKNWTHASSGLSTVCLSYSGHFTIMAASSVLKLRVKAFQLGILIRIITHIRHHTRAIQHRKQRHKQ